jgi:hypothetical protein|tara:strand:- start:196 stop:363 length:168 start_codon:yes stop_codon:yes gene_type:complete
LLLSVLQHWQLWHCGAHAALLVRENCAALLRGLVFVFEAQRRPQLYLISGAIESS